MCSWFGMSVPGFESPRFARCRRRYAHERMTRPVFRDRFLSSAILSGSSKTAAFMIRIRSLQISVASLAAKENTLWA
jgi:hypothetical protein